VHVWWAYLTSSAGVRSHLKCRRPSPGHRGRRVISPLPLLSRSPEVLRVTLRVGSSSGQPPWTPVAGRSPPPTSVARPAACGSAIRLEMVACDRPVRRAISARLTAPATCSVRITLRRFCSGSDSGGPTRGPSVIAPVLPGPLCSTATTLDRHSPEASPQGVRQDAAAAPNPMVTGTAAETLRRGPRCPDKPAAGRARCGRRTGCITLVQVLEYAGLAAFADSRMRPARPAASAGSGEPGHGCRRHPRRWRPPARQPRPHRTPAGPARSW
jgi:hypothetical protein